MGGGSLREGLGFRRGKNSTELQLEYICGSDSFVGNSFIQNRKLKSAVAELCSTQVFISLNNQPARVTEKSS